MPWSTSARSRTVRMFFARPMLFWNSLKRRIPKKASRMIRSDHQSPSTSSDRAIGHSAFSRLVRFTMASSYIEPTKRRVTSLCSCIMKPDALDSNSSLIMQPLEAIVRLANKTALITGGNSGIGLATARLFVAEGARVAITGRNQKTLDAAVTGLGHDVLAIQADVTDIAATARAVAKLVARFGKLDIVFANAGIPGATPVGQTSLASFEEIIRTNLTAVFFTIQAAAPHLNP